MPYFEVILTAACTCLVEAATQKDALDLATAEVGLQDYEFHEAEVGDEIIGQDSINSAVRHADMVIHK